MSMPFVKTRLLSGAAMAALAAPSVGFAQDIDGCGTLVGGAIAADCVQDNAGDIVSMPTGVQTEPEVGPVTNDAGFSISLDGDPVDSDPTIEDRIRIVDIALEEANVQVTFDGFNPVTRLAVETVGAPRAYGAGDMVTLQSETNYPDFLTRGEFRIIDRGAAGGPRLAGVVPVDVNGRAQVQVPAGRDVVVVHRVYDARGRYDETVALPLGQPDDRGLRADVEELADTAAVKNIRVSGGAVTVYADNMSAGSTLVALGTSARPDGSGAAVIQRILPSGAYDVDVTVENAFRPTRVIRPIEVPGSEWFYVVVGDITYYQNGRDNNSDSATTGRFQYYVDGETASGVQITSSLDTTEEEFDEIFDRLDEKDPRSVLDRIDPEDSYPTFGDDSEIYDDTPTSGRFYLRIEKDNNFVVWGDYQSTIQGNTYLRNERALYGVQAVVESNQTTANGDARVSAEIYAAQPEQLVGRETFRGTGGSVYFLSRQDVSPGTETLTIEIRDAVTGRVIDRQRLVAGRDYDVNYLQGVITLSQPLTRTVNNNLIQTNANGDQDVNLVAQYEYTPTTADVDGYSFGGRVEGWVTDDVRVGLTATSDDVGPTTDQTTLGFDVRYQLGSNSFLQLDWARSDGPGFDQDFSIDGGLTIDGTPAVDGEGDAYRLAGQADLRDLGYARDGVIGGYIEERGEGFSSLDYQVTTATGDEQLYGFYANIEATDQALGYGVYADFYENDAGVDRTEIGAEVAGILTPNLRFEVGAEYLDEQTLTTDGDRVDVAGRLTYAVNSGLDVYGFGQVTAASNDLDDYNRYGVGVVAELGGTWIVEGELSGGTGDLGGRILARSIDADGNSRYFGYELDTGRAVDAGVSRTDNGGKYVLGGTQQINDRVRAFGENVYDIFDNDRTLTSAYGLEYVATDYLVYDTAIEIGQIDSDTGDLDRTALSFGMRYDDASLRASARIEYRTDDADPGADFNDFDAIYFNANARYIIDEEQRLILSFAGADSDSDGTSVIDGQLIDASIGYAYRPIEDERLNMLARYRYLKDDFGQEIDGTSSTRIRQESHVFSLEASYDINRAWTLGGKIGGRLSETGETGAALTSNDAYLAVVNARYHLVHNWDVLLEARHLNLVDAGTDDTDLLGAVYRHVGNNAKVGVGYNFGDFSDDLTDVTRNDEGLFINVIAKF